MGVETAGALVSAAEYVRGSTDRQEYSTDNQSLVHRAYAATHRMTIVRTYSDEARSGLVIDRRDALKQLIADVETGNVDFTVILVYDVSRWGRFQDPDEAAYYEYICKRAGVRVIYCAELFENDGSPYSALFKAIKRASAAEYSRELSVKVFNGQRRLINLGYRQGGSAGYGLRRQLVDQKGVVKGLLARGEWKSIQTDRVVLIPGPPDEIEIVRWIFTSFAKQRKSLRELARMLNQKEIRSARGGSWQWHHVRQVLRNENYIGNIVWNRQSVKLKGKVVNNPSDKWVRTTGALEPIIERSLFDAAQAVLRERPQALTQEQKLAPLRRLLQKHGSLSLKLINRSTNTPSASSYVRWFGSLGNAYLLAGFTARSHRRDGQPRRSVAKATRQLSNDQLLEMLTGLYRVNGYLTRQLINAAEGIPSAGTYSRRFGSLEGAYELIGLPWFFSNHPPRKPHRNFKHRTRKQMLDALRTLLRERGALSRKIIDEAEDMPTTNTYQRRFGGVLPAYELIGYDARRRATRGPADKTKSLSNDQLLGLLRKLRRKHGRLSARIIGEAKGLPASSTFVRRFGSMTRVYRLIRYTPKQPPLSGKAAAKSKRHQRFQQLRAKTRRTVETGDRAIKA
jgi:DNA invertase Pin-like site-specific DNA recombinase